MDCQPLNPQILELAMVEAATCLRDCESAPATCPECVSHAVAQLMAGIMVGGCTESRDALAGVVREYIPSFTTDPEEN